MSKYRHELKFLCSEAELRLIESRIRLLMKPDPHTDARGEYLVRSVYFDDLSRSCYYENENGTDPRAKFRIRAYDCSPAFICLEKKSKSRGMTGKESAPLGEALCAPLLGGERLRPGAGEGAPLLAEFLAQRESRPLRPAVLIEYSRKPFVYPLGNVRVTFDRNICASARTEGLFDPHIPRIPLLPTGNHILEVKYDGFLPNPVAELLRRPNLRQSAFSKFYLGCKALEGRI